MLTNSNQVKCDLNVYCDVVSELALELVDNFDNYMS